MYTLGAQILHCQISFWHRASPNLQSASNLLFDAEPVVSKACLNGDTGKVRHLLESGTCPHGYCRRNANGTSGSARSQSGDLPACGPWDFGITKDMHHQTAICWASKEGHKCAVLRKVSRNLKNLSYARRNINFLTFSNQSKRESASWFQGPSLYFTPIASISFLHPSTQTQEYNSSTLHTP